MHGYGHFPYSIQRSISSDLFPYSRHDILILFSYQWIAAHFDAICLFVMNHVMMIVVLLEIPFLEKKIDLFSSCFFNVLAVICA
jgi:hypothetical protein